MINTIVTNRTPLVIAYVLFAAISISFPIPPAWSQGDLTPLDDPVTALQEKSPRSEADSDRLYAYSKFSEARLLFQRGELHAALDRYERSFRYDSTSSKTLNEVVRLSFALNRISEAARYAVLKPNVDLDPLLFHRLAVELTEQGKVEDALKLYDRSLELRGEQLDADLVLLHFELGRLRFIESDFEKAADSFDVVRDALENPQKYQLPNQMLNALLKQPEVTWSLMAESFLEAGRVDDALELFKRSDKDNKRPALFAFHQARIEAQKGEKEKAIQTLQAYFDAKLSVAALEPYEFLEELMIVDEEDEQQKQSFTKRLTELHEADKNNTPLSYFLASHLKDSGEPENAIKIYEQIIAQSPSAQTLRDSIDIYLELKQDEKLLKSVGRFVSSRNSLESLDSVLDAVKKDEALLGRMTSLGRDKLKDAPGVSLALALLSTEAKKFDDAEEFFEATVTKARAAGGQQSEVETLMTWGLEFFMADQYQKATSIFQSAIDKTDNESAKSLQYYYLASALAMDKQYDQALAASERAIELNKKDPRLGTRTAWIHYAAEHYDEAEKAYREFLSQYGENYRTVEARESVRDARLMLSNVLVVKEQFPEAEEALERVLDEFPEDIGAMNDLGYLWADQGKKLGRSLEMIKRAVEAEPENEAYRDSLGWAYYRMEKYDQAITELRKAADIEKPDPVILDHLGDALKAAGKADEAKTQWQRAIDGFRESEDDEKQIETEKKIKAIESEN